MESKLPFVPKPSGIGTATARAARRRWLAGARALIVGGSLMNVIGCAEGRNRPTGDTSALLRVISRSRSDFAPLPRSDRRANAISRLDVRRAPRTDPAAGLAVRHDGSFADSTTGGPYPPGPPHAIRIIPAHAELRVGETTLLAIEAVDSAGRRTSGGVIQWRPSDADLVLLQTSGQITGRAPGSVRIEAWTGAVRATATVEVLPVIRGAVLDLDGLPQRGIAVRLAAAGLVDSAETGDDGRFQFLPEGALPEDVEIVIDAGRRHGGTYHPMVARLASRETGPDLRAVLVPTSWTVASGSYAGSRLPVSADAALRRWRGAAPFARGAGYRGRPTTRVVGWSPDVMPIPVAFARASGTMPVSAADSIGFWEAVRQFETQLGLAAFRPADSSAIGPGSPGIDVVVDPRVPPAAVTWASWGSSGDLNDARVAVRSAGDLRDPQLIAHEMLHALGFGHAVEWRSMMTKVASPSVRTLTVQDVAYAQLIYRIRTAQTRLGARIGFLEAAEGERRQRCQRDQRCSSE